MKNLTLFLSLTLLSFAAFAQGVSVSGTVTDKTTQNAVPFAQVLLVHLPDSTLNPVQADENGRFQFENVAKGRYAVKVLYIGYKNYRKVILVNGQPLRLGALALEENTKLLKEVEIVVKTPPAIQKGDTSEFNTKAYKAARDANAEDIVQKMPGITMQNGKINAQGEEVKKVLVDGKPFFGSDPSAALKNLPAEMIEKIQVFDQQSDQSRMSGFNDGNTTKTINILTKPGAKHGKFGKVYGGAGPDGKFQAGGNINFLNGDQRISIIGQSNNINQQNFSSEDLLGVSTASSGGGGGGRGMGMGGPGGGGGGANNFLVNQSNGITQTHALGLNYSDQWGKKVEVSGSYFFNATDNTTSQLVNRQFITSNTNGQVYRENSNADSKNINHRMNLRLDWKIDSMNSVLWQPKISFQQNNGTSNLLGNTSAENILLNATDNRLKTDLFGYNFTNDLLFNHRFSKRGRSLTANLNTVLSKNDGNRELYALKQVQKNGMLLNDTLNQSSTLNSNGPTIGGELTYTEPITKNSGAILNYNASYRKSQSDQKTYDFESGEQQYSSLNVPLSNVFENTYINQQAGLGYRYQNKFLQANAKVAYQNAQLNNQQILPEIPNLNRSFNNIMPSAMARMSFSKDKNLRFFYRTSTTAPSVTQLQQVVNNTNPLALSTGNPLLDQEYRHFVMLRYSSANPTKGTNFFGFMNAQFAQNYIGNSTILAHDTLQIDNVQLMPGVQLARPVNLNGYYRLQGFANYGFTLKAIKSNLNLNASAVYSRTPGLVNQQLNYSETQTYGAGAVLSSNISQNLDFTISTMPSYNFVYNTQTGLNNNYFNQSSRVKLNWIFWKGFVLQTELNHQLNSGLSSGYNQNYVLWNAAIGKKLFRDDKGEIKLSVFDLLNQNKSIQRNITSAYVEDVQTNVLRQYFMLVFTYNIRSFGTTVPPQQKPEHMSPGGYQPGNYPGGGYPGGGYPGGGYPGR